MIHSLTYNVDVSWSELVEFLDENYLELLCERLHVSRENIALVPFVLSQGKENRICLFNDVELDR